MTKKLKGLLERAHEARMKLLLGSITYDEAVEIVKAYTLEADKKGAEIAKRFGVKYHKIDPRGFLR